MPNLLGRLLGGGGASGSAPAAPTIAAASRTTTSIVLTLTRPSPLTDYAQTRIYYGVEGASASGSQTTSANEQVTFSGLAAGVRYWFVAVAESSLPLNSVPAAPIFSYTSFDPATSSGPARIKAAIKTLMVNGVAGLTSSMVHTRRRYPVGTNEAGVEDVFAADDTKLHAWEIEEEGFSSRWGALNHAAHRDTETFAIRGWYGFDDDGNSEGTFAAVLEDVIEALNADHTLGGTVRSHATPQLRAYDVRTKVGRTCHYAELSLAVRWTHVAP
jgi:hypothetical protein